MSVGQTAPSPFAALLRRSKFASYDPCIGQVYTTHGGHAYRGNWGLKRPLPNRRPVGFITVRSVDSPEQQTEWNSAESSARWLRRWEELGKKLEVHDLGNWTRHSYTWSTDTEFDRAGKVGIEPGREVAREADVSDPFNLIPDPEVMSPKQFKKYLNRIRALRPEFKKYLQDRWREQQAWQAQEAKKRQKARGDRSLPSEKKAMSILKVTGSGEIDMFASAQNASNLLVDEFLKEKAAAEINSLESRRIEARPHKFAGLQYSFLSTLQSRYLHKPAPGRDVVQSRAERYDKAHRASKTDIIAVGGILGGLKGFGAQVIMPTDFGTQEAPRQNREQGKGTFLMDKVKLLHVPSTVGQVPEKAVNAKFTEVEFCTPQLAKANSSNPYPLGSMEYVGWQDEKQSRGGAVLVPGRYQRMTEEVEQFRAQTQVKCHEDSAELLNMLGGMLHKVSEQKRNSGGTI